MNTHLMLDFETLDTKETAVVLSLGAVIFSREEKLLEHLWHFDIQDQIDKGRTISASTLMWWMAQEPAARTVFELCRTEGVGIAGFIDTFQGFTSGFDPYMKVWSNGANFDVPIIENILSYYHFKPNWQYSSVRCYRTVSKMNNITEGVDFDGVRHNALDDAKFQAKCVMKYLSENPGEDR